MDVVTLSRLQFAVATMFHYLFVPLTLGLSVLLALMQTQYVRTGDETWRRMARFFGKLFFINFAIGIVTGITLEFQFGTNWARYSRHVGDVFGALLAIEATTSFFLESTFLAVWWLGWNRLSAKAHLAAIWIVALAANNSAYWIIAANSWMQHPVGYAIRDGRAEVTDFLAVVTQPFALHTFIHTLSGAYILSGMFVMAVSAVHLLNRRHVPFFARAFRLGAAFAFVFALVSVVQGHYHGMEVAKLQPAKLAAMESHWESMSPAPKYLFALPDERNERNLVQLFPIPNLLSYLAFHAPVEVKGLKAFPREERPPVLPVWLSFHLMVGLGTFFPLLTGAACWLAFRGPLEGAGLAREGILLASLLSLPLPWIANQLGWIVTEVGRQPWIVHGVMKTADGASNIDPTPVLVTLVGFLAVYTLLGLCNAGLIIKYALAGPAPAAAKEA